MRAWRICRSRSGTWLDVASCCGFEFNPLLLGEIAGMTRIALLKSLGQIERRHRLVRASGRRFVFDHHQVQEALYDGLSDLLKEEYHAAIAEALETQEHAASREPKERDGALCVSLCQHFFKGAQAARALRYLDVALDHVEGGYLNDQAIELADEALCVPDLVTGEARIKLRLEADRSAAAGPARSHQGLGGAVPALLAHRVFVGAQGLFMGPHLVVGGGERIEQHAEGARMALAPGGVDGAAHPVDAPLGIVALGQQQAGVDDRRDVARAICPRQVVPHLAPSGLPGVAGRRQADQGRPVGAVGVQVQGVHPAGRGVDVLRGLGLATPAQQAPGEHAARQDLGRPIRSLLGLGEELLEGLGRGAEPTRVEQRGGLVDETL